MIDGHEIISSSESPLVDSRRSLGGSGHASSTDPDPKSEVIADAEYVSERLEVRHELFYAETINSSSSFQSKSIYDRIRKSGFKDRNHLLVTALQKAK